MGVLAAFACAAALASLPATAGAVPARATTASAAAVGDCTPGSDWGTVRSDYASRVVDLVNAHRASIGVRALVVSPTLTASAVWKARHMARYG